MIALENIKMLMKDHDTPYIRVYDVQENLVFQIIDTKSTEAAIAKLEQYDDILKSFGRVIIEAATENQKAGNWKNCYRWYAIAGPGSNKNQQQSQPQFQQQPFHYPSGMISKNEADLMASNAALKQQIETEKRFSELEKKIEASQQVSPLEKYLPLAGLIFDIDEKKIAKVGSLMQLQGKLNGPPQTQNPTTLSQAGTELTDDEKQKLIVGIQDDLKAITDKIGLAKLHQLTAGLRSKVQVDPSVADTLLSFIK